MIENLTKALPLVAAIAAACAFLGWSIRGASAKPAAKPNKPAPSNDKGHQDRVKNLEATLEKSKAAHKVLKAELEQVQSTSVSKAAFESVTAELESARKALDIETKRISTLETGLKKSQDTIKNLNARANDTDKAQKDRSFALENELSNAREQLAILQNRPDDSAELHAEIERLRESVAVSSRFAGEVRKRESAAIEAREKAEAQLAGLSDSSRPVASKKIGPVVDSGRIAAAKAEVLRLVEMNKQKEAAAPVDEPAVTPAVLEEPIAFAEESAAPAEETAGAEVETAEIEEAPVLAAAAPIKEKAPAPAELFSLD